MEIKATCSCTCCHSHEHKSAPKRIGHEFIPAIVSFVMLLTGVIMTHWNVSFFTNVSIVEALWYVITFLPVGLPVIKEAWESILERDVFNEFTLMSLACIGAFFIKEYPEGVGVMLFYSIGETLQDRAVEKAKRNIADLLDMRSDEAHLLVNDNIREADPRSIKPGDIIEIRPGERVPLDGIIENEGGTFDTSALTGESLPRTMVKGEEALAGMISSGNLIRLRVTKPFGQSTLSRILEMVEDSAGRKAQTELFIRRFSRIYTPIVVSLSALLIIVPWIVGMANPSFHFVFSEWLYRALVFLVISCPCALVISVPLAYFAGVGASSRAGILVKGGNYLEAISKINVVAFDKTGTLTTGQFTIEKIVSEYLSETELLATMASAELASSHPLAKAIVDYATKFNLEIKKPYQVREIPGYGTCAMIEGKVVLVGNLKLFKKENVPFPKELESLSSTLIACAINGHFSGYVILADIIKPNSHDTVRELRLLGISRLTMLSGDNKATVKKYADILGIKEAYGELLPQDKVSYVENLASSQNTRIAFVGDGMNDAPVLSVSNVGVAMGGLGSDAAIESADIVIQSDSPLKLATAIKIGRYTHAVAMENIIGAIGIKSAIMILGAFGFASLWAAVFADVGVALLAVLNSMRILWKKFQ